MPIYISDSDDVPSLPRRLFGREKPLHTILGDAQAADILLWRNRNLSAGILIVFTIIWFLFEVVEYNFVTLFCHISITMMLGLFMWSIGADLVDWNPPDPRLLTISESTSRWLFDKTNWILSKFYNVSCGKETRSTFFMALAVLWVLSGIGNYFSSLNLLYTGFLCLMTLPALYERYQDDVDHLARKGNKDMKNLYNRIDAKFLNKIPRGPVKEKKKF